MKIRYYLLWLVVALWVLLQELDVLPSFFLPRSAQVNYFVTLFCILTAIGGAWLAYRLTSLKKVKAQIKSSPSQANKWMRIRFALIALAVLPSAFFYYAGGYGESTLYCMLIALVMSLLCFPRK